MWRGCRGFPHLYSDTNTQKHIAFIYLLLFYCATTYMVTIHSFRLCIQSKLPQLWSILSSKRTYVSMETGDTARTSRKAMRLISGLVKHQTMQWLANLLTDAQDNGFRHNSNCPPLNRLSIGRHCICYQLLMAGFLLETYTKLIIMILLCLWCIISFC